MMAKILLLCSLIISCKSTSLILGYFQIIRLGGFRGCIRKVTVNGRAEDLVRDAKAHHGVGQCFPNIEKGAYFGGKLSDCERAREIVCRL